MKRIIFIIIVFISFCKVTYASTYYGEYRKVDDIGNYVNDEVKIETYKLYNTYRTEYIDMGYMLDNNNYIKDENDFIEELINVDVSEKSDEYINIKLNTEETSSLYFYNIPSNLKIYEIELYNNEERKNYGFSGTNKSELKNLYDRNYETYLDSSIRKSFGINTHFIYPVDEITLVIYTNEVDSEPFTIQITNEKFNMTLQNKSKHIIKFNYSNTDREISYEYKTIGKLYKHYKEEKIKLNNYVDNADNLLIDDYIEVNDIYIRDKLVLKDDLTINNKNTKIIDFIEYSTDKVNINCNIDYEINDIYKCDFILNDIIVTKDIIVNISPIIDAIEQDEQTINERLEEKIIEEVPEDNNVIIENCNIEKIQVLENKQNNEYIENKQNNEYIKNEEYNVKEEVVFKTKKDNKKTKNIQNNNTVKITTSKKTNVIKIINKKSKENVNIKDNKNVLNIVKYIIIINLIVIEIILFIKKRKRDNVERV